MYKFAKIEGVKETKEDTKLIVSIKDFGIKDVLIGKKISKAEIRFDDGRIISAEQRKKAYATIRDISDYTGYLPEEAKEQMKYVHIAKTGVEYFSLSDCSMDMAREFINTIIEFALENGVQLKELGIDRTDDVGKYLFQCLKYKKCCICGQDGEVHHVDAIGMGNDRTELDDSGHRKMCLCRLHHTIAHQRGMVIFEKMYKVYGILFVESEER